MDDLELAKMKESNDDELYLTFAVGDEDYGLEISVVTEIITVQTITDVPELPGYIKGIINLRGIIIPVMDVRTRFNKEPKEYDDRTCIVVADARGTSIGLIVDSMHSVMNISNEEITDPSSHRSGYENRYIRGIGKTRQGIKLLLNLERLVADY